MSKACFVTGGTRGIGRAIVEALLSQGHRVAFTGTSHESVARAERELAVNAAKGSVAGIACDVRDPEAVSAAVDGAVQRLGGLDVLVNNAGVGTGSPVAELSVEEWRRILDINLSGPFFCCRAALPHLRAAGDGWIFNISSLASLNPFAGGAAYSASKAGLNAFADALLAEVRHDGVRVTNILPGSVATEFSGRRSTAGEDWRLRANDVAQVIVDLLRFPPRSLPSRVEIRPSQPRKE